jgi:choline dehydrogenase-like flavoprotein
MSPIQEALILVDCETVSQRFYDGVIVVSGVAGAIVGKELSQQGKKVLILEAGQAKHLTLAGFQSYIDTFYSATGKGGMLL